MCWRMAVYLDHNATTRVDAAVADACAAAMRDLWHNPSSGYAGGEWAREGERSERERERKWSERAM